MTQQIATEESQKGTTGTTQEDTTQRSKNGTKILASLAVLALVGGIFTISSLALFTDTETVSGNAFSTGAVDLVATPATAVVTMPIMLPGDQVTASLDVLNSGAAQFRYAVTSTTTEDVLASELVLTIKSGVTACDDSNWTTDGTVEYSGALGSTGTDALIGSIVQGFQAGDRVLAGGANEALCFNVTLPLAATNAAQNLASSATFTFAAEQTSNNP